MKNDDALRRRLVPNADLRGVDLSGLDLRGLDLRGADLRGADLRGARLSEVRGFNELDLPRSFHELDLRGARLEGVRWDGAVGRARCGPLEADVSPPAPAPLPRGRAAARGAPRPDAVPSDAERAAPARRHRPRRRPAAPAAVPEPRGDWVALAGRLLAQQPTFAALAPLLGALRWEQGTDTCTLTSYEHAALELGPLRLALHFVTEHADGIAGPVASRRHESLELTEAGAPRVRVERTPPGPRRLVVGPPALACLLDGVGETPPPRARSAPKRGRAG
jgi:hypothetical protein